MPPRHEFLSPEWIAAVTAIREEYAGRLPEPTVTVRANVTVTDTPFGEDVRGSIDTSNGFVITETVLDDPDFTAVLDYATAEALFLGDDPNALMQAFFGGKIRLTGDSSKLLALPMPNPNDNAPGAELAQELAARVRAVTA